MRSIYKIIAIILLVTPFAIGHYEQRRSLYRRDALFSKLQPGESKGLGNMFGSLKEKANKAKAQKKQEKEDPYSDRNLKKQCVRFSGARTPLHDIDLFTRPGLEFAIPGGKCASSRYRVIEERPAKPTNPWIAPVKPTPTGSAESAWTMAPSKRHSKYLESETFHSNGLRGFLTPFSWPRESVFVRYGVDDKRI